MTPHAKLWYNGGVGIEDETAAVVYERDRGRCVVCGKKAQDIHEIVPRSALPGKRNEGLLFSPRNRCLLCRNCHEKVHTVWGRVMLLGLLKLKYGYKYDDQPFARYFEVKTL